MIQELEEKVAYLEAEVSPFALVCLHSQYLFAFSCFSIVSFSFIFPFRFAQCQGTLLILSILQNKEMRDQMDYFLGGRGAASYLPPEHNSQIVYR